MMLIYSHLSSFLGSFLQVSLGKQQRASLACCVCGMLTKQLDDPHMLFCPYTEPKRILNDN